MQDQHHSMALIHLFHPKQ